MKDLPIHEFAEIWPEMGAADFKGFKEDVRINGQIEPIKLFDGAILDGRNRYRACRELGIEPKVVAWAGTDPLACVISANMHRRHDTESQRAMVAAKLANLKEGRHPATGTIVLVSQEEASSMLNISTGSLKRAKTVIEKGTEELARAVEQGEVPVSAAAKIAKMPRDEQAAALKERKAGRKPRPPREEPPAPEENGERKVLGKGVILAHEAINCLTRIPKNDALRNDGFRLVTDWIRRNK